MTCRHRRTCALSFWSNGHWGDFRRCLDCKEVVPLGKAKDTEQAIRELLATAVGVNPLSAGSLHVAIEAAFNPKMQDVIDLSEIIGDQATPPGKGKR